MKINSIIALLLLLFSADSWAQLRSYSTLAPRKTSLISEKIEVKINPVDHEDQALPALVLGAASAVISPLMKVGKTYLDKRAASFSATYTGAVTEKTLNFRDGSFTPFQVAVTRLTFKKAKTTSDVATAVLLETDKSTDEPVFRFKLKSLQVNASKARIRRQNMKNTGRTVDLNIEIQVSIHYRDEFKIADSTTNQLSYTLKTLTLGTSSITVHGVSPDGKAHDYSAVDDNSLFSDWFQIIPDPVLSTSMRKLISADRKSLACWTTVKVTVKEANPFGVTATKMAEFFSSSEEGFGEFLKALIPSSEKKE